MSKTSFCEKLLPTDLCLNLGNSDISSRLGTANQQVPLSQNVTQILNFPTQIQQSPRQPQLKVPDGQDHNHTTLKKK